MTLSENSPRCKDRESTEAVNDWTLLDPAEGFGQLWRKHYAVDLGRRCGTPQEIVREWRDRFGEFWPEGNRFHPPLTGLKTGEMAISDIEMPAGTTLTTGIVVSNVSPTSFTFKTAQGHTFAGVITFEATATEDSNVASVNVIMRASDPLFEIGLFLGGHEREDRFWIDTLTNLARHFGSAATPTLHSEQLDSTRRWRNASNIIHNGMIHSALARARTWIGRFVGQFSRNGPHT